MAETRGRLQGNTKPWSENPRHDWGQGLETFAAKFLLFGCRGWLRSLTFLLLVEDGALCLE